MHFGSFMIAPMEVSGPSISRIHRVLRVSRYSRSFPSRVDSTTIVSPPVYADQKPMPRNPVTPSISHNASIMSACSAIE